MSYAVPEGAELLRALGAGSTFEVALVEHGGRRCVCKRLKMRLLEEPAGRRAIEREVAVLERARHPALPELIAVGSDRHGPFVIEAAVDGAPLRELVEGRSRSGRAIAPALITALMRGAFGALEELHALELDGEPLELVHGDIAPDHVWVERTRICFIDFGQARWRGMRALDGEQERGSLPYVAPEVLRGEQPPSQAGDVYALAASFAYVALGREPCGSEGPARLVEVAERGLDLDALRQASSLEPAARTALLAALAFEAAERLASAREVVAVLDSRP